MRPLIIGADEAETSGSDGSRCMMYFVPWLYLGQKRKGQYPEGKTRQRAALQGAGSAFQRKTDTLNTFTAIGPKVLL